MAIASKGSSLSLGSGNAAGAIASLTSIDGPSPTAEHFEARTLDSSDAGIAYLPTGFVEPGDISADGFLTTANKGAVIAAIAALASSLNTSSVVISYGNGNGAVSFGTSISGLGITPSASLKDGVKVKIKAKASGLVT